MDVKLNIALDCNNILVNLYHNFFFYIYWRNVDCMSVIRQMLEVFIMWLLLPSVSSPCIVEFIISVWRQADEEYFGINNPIRMSDIWVVGEDWYGEFFMHWLWLFVTTYHENVCIVLGKVEIKMFKINSC